MIGARAEQGSTAAAPAPLLVSWNITALCNLACGHCYLDASRRRRRTRHELGTAAAFAIADQIAALAPGTMVVFSGGEPLLRRDLGQLVRHAAAAGLLPVIGTNGTLLTDRRARELKAAGAAGVGVSVDSGTADFHDRLRGVPGAWNAALKGVAAAHRAGLPVALQVTVFEANRGELRAFGELAESLGAVALNFFFLVCTGRGVTQTDLAPSAYEEALSDIVELQRQRPHMLIRARCAPYLRRLLGLRAGEARDGFAGWSSACLAGRSYFRVTPEGHVTPCPYLPEVIGDATNGGLREIWERHPALIRLRAQPPAGKCGHCDFRYSCGGCRARAFARHGDLMAEDPKCAYVPATGAVAEAEPGGQPTTILWEPAAEARLARIPGFVRAAVRRRLELYAAQEGNRRITVEFMRAHRPPFASISSVCPAISRRQPTDDPLKEQEGP